MPYLLAHGALGWWDEIIFAGVMVFFLVMMGLQWVKSRADAEDAVDDPAASVDAAPENSADRFRLD